MSSTTAQFSEGIIPEVGIFRNNTAYYSGYRWIDGDKVRFPSGVPEKIGGWQKELVSGTFLGVPRASLSWSALDSTRYGAVGTNLFLYIRYGGIYYNITPFRDTASLTDPFTTSAGVSEVTITDVAHNAVVGDYIRITPSVTYDGITFSGDYIVTEYIDADNYKIDAGTNALAGGTGGGAVTIKYYLEAGAADTSASGAGYGAGPYGEETWDTPRTSGALRDARMWCLQNWGEDLLALPLGGKLYYWDLSGGVTAEATEVANAPDRNNFMIVASSLRQVIVFGTENTSAVFDPMLIRWSDEEDYTTWLPDVSNSAGEYRLTRGNKIVGAVETKNGEIIVFTDTSAYRMRPSSGDEVYIVELIGDSCGLLSPFAVTEVDGIVHWMSQSSFKMYTGQVRTSESSVEDYVFDSRSPGVYNILQSIKFHCGKVGDYNEIWFFYATQSSTEIDRYVVYNYGNDSWYDGTMQRTCWEDKAFASRPLAYDVDGNLYIHEQGRNADTSAMDAYVKSGFVDISQGNEIGFCDRYLPDGDFTGDIQLTLYAKKYPQATEEVEKSYLFETPKDQVNTRIRGRLLAFKIASNQFNGDFKLGKLKFAVQSDGVR